VSAKLNNSSMTDQAKSMSASLTLLRKEMASLMLSLSHCEINDFCVVI